MISPLLTDLYQLTMAYGYWKLGLHETDAVFQLIFRKNPFKSNFVVACGLDTVIDFLSSFRFNAQELQYLATLTTADSKPLFSKEFLSYLGDLKFTCDIDAIPEGVLAYAEEPLLRVKGPLLQGQLLESTLLNIINFQTLIATKAARVCLAAKGDPVLEFGMRRAQGPDGALSASRAAYIGGCAATSNVLAGQRFDIPVRGTHAHSWVTVFPDEMSAFQAYAEVMPHNCVLLVDTYNTIQGVKNAIAVGHKLRESGGDLQGIRLDSGDMADLSIKARQLLDEAGFTQTQIIASNSLDEYVMVDLKRQGARISVWGVGTHLVTAYDHPALDGVYKLSALRNKNGTWDYKIKLSEQAVKISTPGIYQIRRFFKDQTPLADVLYDEELGISSQPEYVPFRDNKEPVLMQNFNRSVDLLQPVFREGQLTFKQESIHLMRDRALSEVHNFMKFYPDQQYLYGLEKNLYQLKQDLIKKASINVKS